METCHTASAANEQPPINRAVCAASAVGCEKAPAHAKQPEAPAPTGGCERVVASSKQPKAPVPTDGSATQPASAAVSAYPPDAPRSPLGSIGWPEGQEEGFIPVEGGRVFYHLYGKNQPGLPILFLHGGPGGSCRGLYSQIPLSEHHPLIGYNQLGSDGSDYAEGTALAQAQSLMTIDHFVAEAQTVVDYFGLTSFMIVGSSWGTMLAVEYAAKMQPAGLKGLVLSGPFLSVDIWCADGERLIKSLPVCDVCGEPMDGNAMWETVIACEQAGTFDDARYTAINGIYKDHFGSRFENKALLGERPSDKEVSRYTVEGASPYNYMWGPSEFSCNGTLKGHDSTPLLKEIAVPILYLCGEYDSGTPEAASIYKARSNNAEITVLGGCAHNASAERSVEYNAVIEGFARRISR